MVNLLTTETTRGSDHHLEAKEVSDILATSTLTGPIAIPNGLQPGKATRLFSIQSAMIRLAATDSFAKVVDIEFPVDARGENVRGTFCMGTSLKKAIIKMHGTGSVFTSLGAVLVSFWTI